MTNQNFSFVTRLRPRIVYEVKSKQDVFASKGILADEYIELSSDYAKKRGVTKRLSCIKFYDKKRKERLSF